jgi:hypothetical protein
MKFQTELNVCMYSGMCHLDPKVVLTQEQSDQLLQLVNRVDSAPITQSFGMHLGIDQFIVSFLHFEADDFWDALKGTPEIPEIIRINSSPGQVGIWRRQNALYDDMLWYKDEVGIHAFLSTLAAPAIEKHYTESFPEPTLAVWGDTLTLIKPKLP